MCTHQVVCLTFCVVVDDGVGRQMRAAAAAFSPVGERWWLGLLLRRWRHAVDAELEQRAAQLRAEVLVQATFRCVSKDGYF